MDPIITLSELSRSFKIGTETVNALNGVSLTINKNEYVALMGPSGSGKSTLMNLFSATLLAGYSRFFFDSGAQIRNTQIHST